MRPRGLFAINCGFFLIASFYDLAFDIGYLVIINREVTVQTCSIVRNFVYNPIATQGFVDALERFCIAFFSHEMSMITVFVLYTLFPLICIGIGVYNTFISTTLLQTDDVCAIVRRTKWTNITLVIIQWGSAAVAVLLYIAIWKQLQRRRSNAGITPVASTSHETVKLCITRYYWDPTIVRVFFICCVLPLVLAIPSVVFTLLTESAIYQNAVSEGP
ncbi:unnamed protein product [Angiostrongylus costaricensis]|uniref:G_PROTEIN_RECEP_F1_2 domain-containing protein n=1 Tax=Angiostrongylus costaricensis TaxID=334426 RepID=A0A0R3PV53_ANGCS|nr:unnamed protein product [Angiostrongylus costaricensis]